MPSTDRLLPPSDYVFDPSARTIDFSAMTGFDRRRLLAIINNAGGETIYFQGEPELAYQGNGALLTFPYDTTAMSADDPLSIFYEAVSATSTGLVLVDYSGAIVAGAAAVTPLAADAGRRLIILSNTGSEPLAYRFKDAATALAGHPLSPGKSIPFSAPCPTDALSLFSTNGTTFLVSAG
jgi:hypothetical protein